MSDVSFDILTFEVNSSGALTPRAQPLPINYPLETEVEKDIVYGYEDQFTGSLVSKKATLFNNPFN